MTACVCSTTSITGNLTSAERMALIVYSNQELGALEKCVTGLFGQIHNKDIGPISYKNAPTPYTAKQLQRLRRIKTVSKSRKLIFTFYFPSMINDFRSNPLKVLSFLIGHEGKGSLLSHLVSRQLALELMSYTNDTADYYTVFGIHITLTEKGFAEYESVVESLFAYIAMVRQNGMSKEVFYEIQTLNNLSFEFQSKANGVGKAIELAGLLSQCPPELINRYSYLMEEFQPERFKEIVEHLTPANLVIDLRNHDFEGLPLKEPIYGTEYAFDPLRPELVARVDGILKGDLTRRENPCLRRLDDARGKSIYSRRLPHFERSGREALH